MASPNGLSNLSLSELQNIIRTRRKQLARLERCRAKLLKRVEAIDSQICELGGTPSGGGRRGGRGAPGGTRPRNAQSLPEAIHDVLAKAKTPVAVRDVAERVRAAGYRSSSGNFRSIVNQTLVKDARFASAGRASTS